MRTAKCVASQTVPNNKTTPSNNSATIAALRWRGDGIDVTCTVAQTSVNIAPKVIATMSTVVKIESKTRFIAREG